MCRISAPLLRVFQLAVTWRTRFESCDWNEAMMLLDHLAGARLFTTFSLFVLASPPISANFSWRAFSCFSCRRFRMCSLAAFFCALRFIYERPMSTPPVTNSAASMPPSPTLLRQANMAHIRELVHQKMRNQKPIMHSSSVSMRSLTMGCAYSSLVLRLRLTRTRMRQRCKAMRIAAFLRISMGLLSFFPWARRLASLSLNALRPLNLRYCSRLRSERRSASTCTSLNAVKPRNIMRMRKASSASASWSMVDALTRSSRRVRLSLFRMVCISCSFFAMTSKSSACSPRRRLACARRNSSYSR
mmetsp:Transcript_5456/g.18967  ORF Transcript_5456/g.18967 Transcript_5456/m.18967 type:complete len:302 (-) Transcript_5456:548-1453(-)